MATHTLSPSPTSPHVGRRAALGTLLAGGASVAGITAGAAGALADVASPGPDAELIAICQQHIRNREVVNSTPDLEDEDPRWDAYNATADAISAARPVTIQGMAAKARATKNEATLLDGTENPEAMSLDWAWDLINDLIRLGEGAAV